MASHRQIKIQYGNSEPYYVESIQEAIQSTGCSKTSIRNCLDGDIKSCKGFKFSYAQLKPTDKKAHNQKDSSQQVKGNKQRVKVKVVDVETGDFVIYKSQSECAKALGISNTYTRKLIDNGTIYHGNWRKENGIDPNLPVPTCYHLPFKCLVPERYENIIAAGRMLNADQPSFGALRVMVNLNQIGEAAGVAAAISVDKGVSLQDVDGKEVRKVLQKGGSVL